MFPKSKEEFINYTKIANLIPVYQEYSAALETPLSVFLKLKKSPHTFLLESREKGIQIGRYSFIGFEPSQIFHAKDGIVTQTNKDKTIKFRSKDPVKDLEKIFERYQPLQVSGLPNFIGGAVGYLGYDMVRYWEQLPKSKEKDTDFPDCFFMFTDNLIIFDHLKQTMKILINVFVGENPEEDYLRAVNKIKKIKAVLSKPLKSNYFYNNHINMNSQFETSYTSQDFQAKVKKAKDYISDGDIFQVVLSQKFEFPIKSDPLLIYCSLRSLNPSPYLFYLQFDDICLIGSSPEIMIKVENGTAEVRPIAGTRPRGNTEEEDEKLAQELITDEKEKAEHLMLVDLGRNDLGRVSKFGSVKVEEFMQIEKYSHVMHLVSKVVGKVKEGCNCFDVLRASFPAGTVSGAPKIRAMEIIDELETVGRGPYAGAVGYFSYTGNMDTCITIRTLFIKGEKGYIQAGAGIVMDSDPVREYIEVCNKAQVIINAVDMVERGGLS